MNKTITKQSTRTSMKGASELKPGTRRKLGDITNVNGSNGSGKLGKLATSSKPSESTLSSKVSAKASTPVSVPLPLESSKPVVGQLQLEGEDIDAGDGNTPELVSDYVQDIYCHMREREIDSVVDSTYMLRQPHINEKMRGILIDWLVEVHQKFRCVPETLYLTINLIDRFLGVENVSRKNLQLIGVTAFMIAAKYEEIYPPDLRDLISITAMAYSQHEITETEIKILSSLNFKISIASTHSFLLRYLKAAHADNRMAWIACFITERVLHESEMLSFLPSVVASCSVYLARLNVNYRPWSPTLLKYTKYTESSLEPCLKVMTSILTSETSLAAVYNKYRNHKFGAVSNMALKGL